VTSDLQFTCLVGQAKKLMQMRENATLKPSSILPIAALGRILDLTFTTRKWYRLRFLRNYLVDNDLAIAMSRGICLQLESMPARMHTRGAGSTDWRPPVSLLRRCILPVHYDWFIYFVVDRSRDLSHGADATYEAAILHWLIAAHAVFDVDYLEAMVMEARPHRGLLRLLLSCYSSVQIADLLGAFIAYEEWTPCQRILDERPGVYPDIEKLIPSWLARSTTAIGDWMGHKQTWFSRQYNLRFGYRDLPFPRRAHVYPGLSSESSEGAAFATDTSNTDH
jgi:hypothetical protein